MTTVLTGAREHLGPGPAAMLRSSEEPSQSSAPASRIRDRAGSSFTALTRSIHEMGLMRRRYGYYWTKLIGAVLILAAWVVAFILDRRQLVAARQRRSPRGSDDPDLVLRA